MNFVSRMLLALLALAVIALGVWSGLVTTHVLDGIVWTYPGVAIDVNPAEQLMSIRLVWLVSSVVVTAVGMLMLLVSSSGGEDDSDRVTLKAPDPQIYGDTRVTMTRAGVRSIVAHAAQAVEGVREADANATLTRRGWTIRCRVATWDRTVIPEMAPRVVSNVRTALEHHTGIPVADVQIDTQYEPLRMETASARVA